MKDERDELVKRVFPLLRRKCEERGVTWGEVDLRWGITDEQKAEGKVLPICLAEIEKCHPFFIGLLGERYGWIPDTLPDTLPEILKEQVWMDESCGRSVTELEILYGVLNRPDMEKKALFYFRDASYIDSLPADTREYYMEKPTDEEIAKLGTKQAELKAEERRGKLLNLKNRILANGLPVKQFCSARELGKMVLSDLEVLIDNLYPVENNTDPENIAVEEQASYVTALSSGCIERANYYDFINKFILGDESRLLVFGESGIGKSALLASWLLKFTESLESPLFSFHKYSTESASAADGKDIRGVKIPIIYYFLGASSQTSEFTYMLRYLMGRLKHYFDIREEIKNTADELREQFANWLNIAAARGRAILLIEGLDQLDEKDGAYDLTWLPPEIPSNMKLILSTVPGMQANIIRPQLHRELLIMPPDKYEKTEFIYQYFKQGSKSLSDELAEKIVDAKQTENPLYLKLFLNELRQHGDHFTLMEFADKYLSAASVAELVKIVLSRCQMDYEADRKNLVRDSLSLLWVSKKGLSESELLELLGSADARLPHSIWSPFFISVSALFVNHNGLIRFANEQIRKAVEDYFLADENSAYDYSIKIAEYFEKRSGGARKLEELLWQLLYAKSWNRLYKLLGNLEFLKDFWSSDKALLKECWVAVENNSGFSMVTAYQDIIKKPCFDIEIGNIIQCLLEDTGKTDEALLLLDNLIEVSRNSKDELTYAGLIINKAVSCSNSALYNEALELLDEAGAIYERNNDKSGHFFTLRNKARVFASTGYMHEAERYYLLAKEIASELGEKTWLSSCFQGLSGVYFSIGDTEKSIVLVDEAEKLNREQGDKEGVATCILYKAFISENCGDQRTALSLLKEAELAARKLGNNTLLCSSLNRQGVLHRDMGETSIALELFDELELLCRKTGNRKYMAECLGHKAPIVRDSGDLKKALELHLEEERIMREIGDRNGVSVSLNNQGIIKMLMGEYEASLKLFREYEQISSEVNNTEGVARALMNQAGLLYENMGQINEALKIIEQAEKYAFESQNVDLIKKVLSSKKYMKSNLKKM